MVLLDSAGTSTTAYTYAPFGETQTSSLMINDSFQFTARENDATGPYYYRARYYSPQLQRFISEDPIGLLGDLNLYAYVTNNPTRFIDPYGLVFGIPAGERFGETALQHWADRYVETGNPGYLVPGAFAALWTRDTSTQTALTLGSAYALAGWAARTGPWAGKVAYHAAHRAGPHQFPHIQFIIRTGRSVSKAFRIRLPEFVGRLFPTNIDFFALLPLGLLPTDTQFCLGQRKCGAGGGV